MLTFNSHWLPPSSSERFWQTPAEPEGLAVPGDKFPLKTPLVGGTVEGDLAVVLDDVALDAAAIEVHPASLNGALDDLVLAASGKVQIRGHTAPALIGPVELAASASVMTRGSLSAVLEALTLDAEGLVTGDTYHAGTTPKWRVPVL